MSQVKCEVCDDKKILRIEGTNILVPCLHCDVEQERLDARKALGTLEVPWTVKESYYGGKRFNIKLASGVGVHLYDGGIAHLIASVPTWLCNSLDREEQLIAENKQLIEEIEQQKEYINGLVGPDRRNANQRLIAENERLKEENISLLASSAIDANDNVKLRAKVAEQDKEIQRYKEALAPSVVYSAIRHYYKQGLFEHEELGDIENAMDLIGNLTDQT